MVPRARATRALVLAAFASAWTFACVMTFSRFPATPSERSGRFPTREDDARARAVFDAHAGHVAFAASARGAFESRSRGVDPFRALTAPRVSSTARPTPSASTSTPGTRDPAPRPKPPAGGAARTTTSPRFADLRGRRGHGIRPRARRRRAVPPATDHLDQLDQLDPHEVAVILVDDPTRPDETPLREERRDEHPRGRHLRERDDAAMDEGAGRRASPTTGTRSKSVVGAASSARERRGPYDRVVRVRRVSHARARRDHLTRRLLPALRDASEDADALDVRVHTSDADLCDAVRAADPRTRCERTSKTATMTATMTATIDASSVTNPSSKDSKDSAARREWYARETTDMIAALESAEAAAAAPTTRRCCSSRTASSPAIVGDEAFERRSAPRDA